MDGAEYLATTSHHIIEDSMIPERQNDAEAQKLLKARQQLWHKAQRTMVFQINVTVVVPIVLALVALLHPVVRPYGATFALFISVVDASLLDRAYRGLMKRAAKASEQFDCTVLELPWNEFLVGGKLDPETIHEEATSYERRTSDSALKDWYSPAATALPHHLSRIVCQRTNLWYDAKLRAAYSNSIPAALCIICAALAFAGLLVNLTLSDFVLTILAPMAPLVLWSVREYFRQRDAAAGQDSLKTSAEAFWKAASDGQITPDGATKKSREFQDAIFTRRASSPLLPPGIYWTYRSRLEEQMKVGAEALVAEYGSKQP
ncbi:hypothetical protein E0H36_18575 [Rhizobium leguminosarum bv. viciae]|uniref:S-4TM family putative pore-forming effector n=1 Tax=Rhizobium leguminosarum TaxID=384 RepID=UPI001030D7F6|nr:S-4TM family putative pore-forming effector [Rhizobium leguminosarum]MBY5485191.1 hypothetical protein [Rhizobium leguminosarum]TAY88128.1 hypothetical protein ELH83_10010 [Rhizobium leguminosarum]TBZ31246.1 hypothetical protein E0H36_18575 [Rhizobium leguminosarum bv. viciae]